MLTWPFHCDFMVIVTHTPANEISETVVEQTDIHDFANSTRACSRGAPLR
jgi:hypothetical protein